MSILRRCQLSEKPRADVIYNGQQSILADPLVAD
jgi:hypothetical protein